MTTITGRIWVAIISTAVAWGIAVAVFVDGESLPALIAGMIAAVCTVLTVAEYERGVAIADAVRRHPAGKGR